jgi:hypothetical protein
VCSAACRLAWRRKQAKLRRARDLEGHQAADCARQQAWRDARRAAPVPPVLSSQRVMPVPSEGLSRAGIAAQPSRSQASSPGRDAEGLSRAGIAAQPHGTKEEILLAWDKASRLSRASLERDLTEILGESASILGQVGQDRQPVTRREAGRK